MLRGLEDLDERVAFGVDIFGVLRKDVLVLDRVDGGLDMVGANGLDNLVEAFAARDFGLAGAAEQPEVARISPALCAT